MSKPVLYFFELSVWSSAPRLAADELGYGDKLETKHLNLVEGQNFEPSFIKVNPNATLPTLTASGKVYKSTAEVVRYLVENAPNPAGKSTGTEFIDKVHAGSVDPNFLFVSSRNEVELKAKGASIPGLFVRGRQAALERIAPTAPEFKAFYDAKKASNGFVVSLFDGTAPPDAVQGFLAQSRAHWKNVSQFILEEIPRYLPESGFIGGDRPGEADFHFAAWLADTVGIAGGTPSAEGVKALEKELGGSGSVPTKLENYWRLWSERESWKTQYANGLH